MTALFIALFLLVTAALFAAWPIIHLRNKPVRHRLIMASSLILLVLGLGFGLYLILGQPYLALRNAEPEQGDLRAVVAQLAHKSRDVPNDPQAFLLLGRGYLALNENGNAAQSFRRALSLQQAKNIQDAETFSAYGEALTRQAKNLLTEDAKNAFEQALKLEPRDPAARYYLGLFAQQRGDKTTAQTYWQSLLRDLPASPLRSELVDRLATLKGEAGESPDISAMVNALANRLKTNPQDPEGWQRLIQSYLVLGEQEKAQNALHSARLALAKDPDALAALEQQARAAKLSPPQAQ